MFVFNPYHLEQHHARIRAHYPTHAFLIDHVWQNMADRLQDIKREFHVPYHLGARINDVVLNTLYKGGKFTSAPLLADFDRVNEQLHLASHASDCLLSVFDLHTVNDLPGVLTQIRQALNPDGLFLAALPGGETLHELRQAMMEAELDLYGGASPRIHPMIDLPQMAALMQRARFALPVVDSERIVIEYSDLPKLLHDLRGMGESNVVATKLRHFTRAEFFARASAIYHDRFANKNGRIPATFDIIYVIGWAPT